MAIYNGANEKLGKIEEIVIDPAAGKIRYAVLSYGGLLGIGDKYFAVPWQKLSFVPKGQTSSGTEKMAIYVIPRLVFCAIKSDSPTGYLRNPRVPNKRGQDGDKQPLLCPTCENRFSASENSFAENIFVPFHEADKDQFSYGPWPKGFEPVTFGSGGGR